MKIRTIWIGAKIIDDGTSLGARSEDPSDWYLALRHNPSMALTDELGFPRTTQPGDIFWISFPVRGMELILQEGALKAKNGSTVTTLKEVTIDTIFSGAQPLVNTLIHQLQSAGSERKMA